MLLILTSQTDTTADYLCQRLECQKHTNWLRLDTDATPFAISHRNGTTLLRIKETWIAPGDIQSLWFRRPVPLGAAGSDAEDKFAACELAASLEGFFAQVPERSWVNHPANNARAAHKIHQLVQASIVGIRTPDTLVTQSPDALREFYALHDGRVIAKPLSYGYIERDVPTDDSLIYTSAVSSASLEQIDCLTDCPTLFQQRIDKAYDVRVTIIDRRTFAVRLDHTDSAGKQILDVRRNNMKDVAYTEVQLPAEVERALMELMNSYKLRFGAIDLAVSRDGDWYFLEANPNGQWAWFDQLGITNITEALIRAFFAQDNSATINAP